MGWPLYAWLSKLEKCYEKDIVGSEWRPGFLIFDCPGYGFLDFAVPLGTEYR